MNTEYIGLIVFFAIYVLSSSNVLKMATKVYFPNIKIGAILAIVFGLLLSISYGSGLANMLFDVNYSETLFPKVFQVVDLILSGLLYTLGSKIATDFLEKLTIKGK